MYSCLSNHCLNFVLFLVLYLYTALFEKKNSLIALCSKLLVNLNLSYVFSDDHISSSNEMRYLYIDKK